jgi:hypothetical protein
MDRIWDKILQLIRFGDVRVSEHGYDEIAADKITIREIIDGIQTAMTIEEYPEYPKGPSVLVLQNDRKGRPIHVVWGIPKGRSSPAVLVTAYRPDPERWTKDFLRRRR